MKKLLLFLPILFLIISASAQKIIKTEQVTDHSTHVVGDKFEGVIFFKNYPFGSVADSVKRFTPKVEQIVQTENILEHQLEKLYRKYPKSGEFYVSKHIEEYLRQYSGFIDKKGDSIIVITGFTKNLLIDEAVNKNKKTKIPHWFTDIIEMFDGGSSIWHGNVDLNTRKLTGITINGLG